MKKSLITLAALAFAGAASATYCPAGTVHAGSAEPIYPNRCNEGYNPPATGGGSASDSKAASAAAALAGAASQSNAGASAAGGHSTAAALGGNATGGTATGGNAAQRQQQAQQQGQTLSNRNDNSSGVVIQGNQAGSGDRSSYNATAWAPILHGPAAPALASGNLVVVPGICGPRVRIITAQVVGQHYGAMGGQTDTPNGYTETLGEYLDENGNPAEPFVQRGGYLIGHQVTQYAAVLGTSSAASFSVGGFVDSKGLQGGAAGSGARQQLVKGLQVMECVVPVERPAVVVLPPALPPPARKAVHRRAVTKPCPVSSAPAKPICTAWKISTLALSREELA